MEFREFSGLWNHFVWCSKSEHSGASKPNRGLVGARSVRGMHSSCRDMGDQEAVGPGREVCGKSRRQALHFAVNFNLILKK